MSLFYNPNDEERLCQVLKAYVEEFGAENVIVFLPTCWQNCGHTLGKVRVRYINEKTIAIRVEYKMIRLNYEVPLRIA